MFAQARARQQARTGLDGVRVDRLVAALVERAEGRGGVDVRFHAELEPAVIRGEPDRVNRAVSNLLDNAVKWSPTAGPSISRSATTAPRADGG